MLQYCHDLMAIVPTSVHQCLCFVPVSMHQRRCLPSCPCWQSARGFPSSSTRCSCSSGKSRRARTMSLVRPFLRDAIPHDAHLKAVTFPSARFVLPHSMDCLHPPTRTRTPPRQYSSPSHGRTTCPTRSAPSSTRATRVATSKRTLDRYTPASSGGTG